MNIILDNIIEESPSYEDNLYNVEKDILTHEKPNNWNVYVENSMERILEVDFHEFALLVTSETGQDLKNISAFVFYSTVSMLEKKHTKNKK